MSIWLRKRVAMWCALVALLGGGWWFSSVQAQNEMVRPAKTPTEAAANFIALMNAFAGDDTMFNLGPSIYGLFENTLSRAQMQKIDRFDDTSQLTKLFLEMAQTQRNARYTSKFTEESANKVVVELQKNELSTPPPIVCVAEDGGWRVDFFSTYAKWQNVSDLDRDLLVAKLTGEISPLLAQDPERVRILNRAQENARGSNCMSNLKQISLGILQYAQDYDEKMPPAREWAEVIQPYVRSTQIFRCPSVTDPKGFGYALNSRLSRKGYDVLGKINPAQMVMIYETSDLRWNAYGLGEKPAFRHFEGANYAFFDGHVKWYKKGQPLQFTFQSKK